LTSAATRSTRRRPARGDPGLGLEDEGKPAALAVGELLGDRGLDHL
jgi:hypothetical protein